MCVAIHRWKKLDETSLSFVSRVFDTNQVQFVETIVTIKLT